MDYRDERDALRARLESIESELASARAESERLRATENALAAAQHENEKLRAEVRALQPRTAATPVKPSTGPAGTVASAGVVALTAVVAGYFFVVRSEPPEPPRVVVVAPGPAAVGDDWLPKPAVVAPTPVAPTPVVAQPVPSETRTLTVQWAARVASAQDSPLAPGTPCVIQAKLSGNGRSAGADEVEVACSGKTLYRSTDALNGMSSSSEEVEQASGPGDTVKFALSYEDQGARSGARAQVTIQTAEHTVTAWRDGGYRVKLTVDEFSAPVGGKALIDVAAGGFRETVRRTGKVAAANGTALFAPGAACTVEVRPASDPKHNCKVRVRCGTEIAYGEGNSGFNTCTVEGSSVLTAVDSGGSDEDRDPRLDMDLPRGTVEVSDTGASPWSLKIQLAPAAR